jgi:DNA-binding MarR family transcriptional regulator
LFELLNLRNVNEDKPQFDLNASQLRALDSLAHFEQSIERVAGISGMTLSEAGYTLGSLQKLGLVSRTSNGWVKYSNTL